MGQLKKLAGQTAVYGLSSIVGRLLNYFLVPWYTRIFDKASYGVVTDLYAYTVVFLILLTYGMETAFFSFSKTEKDSESVYTTSLVSLFSTSLLFVFLIFIFRSTVSSFLGYPNFSHYILWFGLIIGFDAFLSLPFAKLRNQNKSLVFAGIKLFSIGANIFFNIFFLLILPYLFQNGYFTNFQSTYYSIDKIGYVFLSNLIASILTAILLIPTIFSDHGRYNSTIHKNMFWYGLPLLFAGLAGSVNEVFDRILLKYLLIIPEGIIDKSEYVLSQIGIYGANYKLSIIMTLFIQTFRYAFEPFFFSNSDKKDSKALYARILKYFLIFCLSIFLFVTFGIDLFKHFIGENFREGLAIVPILLLANLFLGLVFNLSVWYKVSNNTKYGAFIAISGAVITLLSNIILIPFYGYMGSAIATLVCYFSMAVLSYFLGQKYYKIDYDLKSIIGYIIFAGFIYMLAENMHISNIYALYLFKTSMLILFFSACAFREYKLLKV